MTKTEKNETFLKVALASANMTVLFLFQQNPAEGVTTIDSEKTGKTEKPDFTDQLLQNSYYTTQEIPIEESASRRKGCSLPDVYGYFGRIAVYFLYLAFGAAIFLMTERPNEIALCEAAQNISNIYMAGTEVWVWTQFNKTKPEGSEWNVTLSADNYVLLVDSITTVARDTGALLEHGCPENWTFKNAFYFVGTVITTIGYGNVAPKTKYGKMFCVVYALFGVPYFYYLMKVTGNYLHKFVKSAGFYRFRGKKTTITLYIVIGFGIFSVIPSFFFSNIENWEFLDAFYFTIITLTTIGFGDLTPSTEFPPNNTFPACGEFCMGVASICYRIICLLWMLMGLSWLGGLIQIAVDVAFREDKDKNKKDLHEPVSRQFFDQTTQTSPNYSSQGPFSP